MPQKSNDFKITLKFTDKNIEEIRNVFSDKNVSKVKVRIEATHSGFINANNFFYTPMGMKDGIPSFTEPYGKPICVNHNTDVDPVGRIYEANYIDYKQYDSSPLVKKIKTNPAAKLVDTVKEFIKTPLYRSPSYKGLGHSEIYAEITDQDAMQKVLDKRYLTVSVSGGVDSAYCSVCGVDKLSDSDNTCSHYRGEIYDGEKAFLIGGNMKFKETSYVNIPADPNTDTKIIQDSTYEFMDGIIEIVDYVQSGEQQMKKKLQEVLANSKQILSDTLIALGLDQYSLQDADYEALRKPQFLFAGEKAFPIHDKAHILAAFKILEEVEDSEEKTQALTVLNRKFEKEVGKDVSIEDAIAELAKKPEEKNKENQNQQVDISDAVSAAIEKIAPLIVDAVVLKLKESVKVSDSYTGERVEALESEVEILIKENSQLTDKYKEIVINQILAKENKLEDAEYKEKLSKRSLQSLSDKLEDLGIAVVPTTEKPNKEKQIKDADLNAGDAGAAGDEGAGEGDGAGEGKGEGQEKPLTNKEIKDEYQKLFTTKGISAANRYLADLRDNNKLPDNFTF